MILKQTIYLTTTIILHYNKFDLQLYEYARAKFDKIVSSMGEQFQGEVKQFQKLNKLQSPFRKLAREIYKKFQ